MQEEISGRTWEQVEAKYAPDYELEIYSDITPSGRRRVFARYWKAPQQAINRQLTGGYSSKVDGVCFLCIKPINPMGDTEGGGGTAFPELASGSLPTSSGPSDSQKDGFRKGSGCFPCEDCGKLTRRTPETSGTNLCKTCFRKAQKETGV